MNNALRVEQEDDTIYIIRSQCLSKLGRAAEAIQDAEVALSSDRCLSISKSDQILIITMTQDKYEGSIGQRRGLIH